MLKGLGASPDEPSRQKRNKLFYNVMLVLAVMHLAAQLFLWLPLHLQPAHMQADYQIYYFALRNLHEGASIYLPWPDYGPHLKPMRFLYPPPFLAFFYPLGWLSELWFARILYVLIVTGFWIYAWCLARLFCQRATWDKILISGLLLSLCPGVVYSMSLGNVQIMLTALWGAAFAFPVRTLALAAAACVKIHPIWPLTVSFFDRAKRDGWRQAMKNVGLPALLFFTGAFLLGIVICGPNSFLLWTHNISPLVSQGTFDSTNISLPMSILRMLRALGWWHYEVGPLPAGPRLFLTCSTLIGPLWSWWLARRWADDLRQAFVGAAIVLFAPLCWLDYSGIFLVPLCIWQRERRLDIQR